MLRAGALGGLGIVVAGSIDAIAAPEAMALTRRAAGYGALVPDPAGVLSLPHGFSYKVVAKAGETLLDSGEPSPSDPDGAAVFEGREGWVMVQNHEIGGSETYGVPALEGLAFDPGARGGTTTIVMDKQGNRISEYVSIAGTHNNCAGGRTPWSTWLTCEETEQRKGGVFQQDHGWTFEVDAFDRAANLDPVPLKFLGRYAHEAVAVDPKGTIYLTEDANGPHGLYYRWTPPAGFKPGKGALRALALSEGGDTAGSLQAMLCTKGTRKIANLSEATRVGTTYNVTWVDVPDPLATTTSVRQQFAPGEVTGSRKLEGAYWGDGGAYFVASFARASDGSTNEHDGQVWFYNPGNQTVTLKSIFGVNPDPDADTHYDGPDNIALDPNGGLILAEDGEGIQHLVGVTTAGIAFPLARNDVSDSEFAGPVFTEDGEVLFACIQGDGYTFAITGPWK
ncbi:alkaline phosphatase PhoX [Actinopolymorpha sp. B11F2]|uniref:alkaline phosphatase PhoX n=1 Tax=Actinopolymorpha sp. B11F2 TaxID=3160862 RepID=UPI0032E49F60